MLQGVVEESADSCNFRTSVAGLLCGGHAPSPFSVDYDDGMIPNSLIRASPEWTVRRILSLQITQIK